MPSSAVVISERRIRRRDEPPELPARSSGSLRSTRNAGSSAFCNRAEWTPECPRGRAPPSSLRPASSCLRSQSPKKPGRFFGGAAGFVLRPNGVLRIDLVCHDVTPAAIKKAGSRPLAIGQQGLECPEPIGLDRRCKTRWADSRRPMPTHRTLGRSWRLGLVTATICGKRVSKMNESVSAKSWMYFVKSPSNTVKKLMCLRSKETKSATGASQ